MNIEIKLDDPKRCHPCPFSISDSFRPYCEIFKDAEFECFLKSDGDPIRPQECIDKHGE